MDELEQELKVCFLDEASQLIEETEQCFLEIETNREDASIIEKIFRAAHNLKGSSRAVGFSQMAEFTHVFESLLLKVKNKELSIDSAIVNLLLRCNDHLRNWVQELRGNLDASVDSESLVTELQAAISGSSASAPPPAPASPPTEQAELPQVAEVHTSEIATEENPREPLGHELPIASPDQLAGLEAPAPSAASGSWEEALPPANLFEEGSSSAPPLPVAEKSEPPKAAHVAPPAPQTKSPEKSPSASASKPAASSAPPPEDETVRVSLKRLESLVNFVGELVIMQTVLNQHRHLIESPLLTRTIGQLAKITKDIQDISMSLRMVPLKQTFQKMQRIVRDTSKALKKDVNFTIRGEQTEIDKTVVEQLGDPLVHLVRNACDHGIESNDEREALGKPRVGNISLEAFHKGGQIVIEVRDDGKGLDAEKLRAKAIEKGILRPEQVISHQEALNLIFAAGFSTKTEVTEVSGRGVGMDVVKTNIEKNLHGEIELETEVGKGTCLRIKLPLTLAIIDGMVVKASEERYVVPINHVHESLQPTTNDIHFVTGVGEVLSLRGEELPLYRLTSILGRKTAQKSASECIAIVVRSGERPYSILVDDIIGQQQIVIKQLGAEVRNYLRGVSGSAILGDGKAALILDVNELCHRALGGNRISAA